MGVIETLLSHVLPDDERGTRPLGHSQVDVESARRHVR
jgi:hypothetical protein